MKNEIDLGQEWDDEPMGDGPREAPKKSYPTLYITTDDKLDLPEGEFTFTCRGRVVDRGENTRDESDPKCRYEIEVQTIAPDGASPKAKAKSKDPVDSLESAMKGESDDDEDYSEDDEE